jgi:prephenate dehydrogenase
MMKHKSRAYLRPGTTATHLWNNTCRRQITNCLRESIAVLLAAARDYRAALDEWIEALERGDDERLQHLLETGKQQRDSVGN